VSKLYGFLQLRRGLWEHVRNGSLTHTGALVYIYMLTQADTRTGVWKGSAQCIATDLNIPKSTAKYALRGLDGRYIKRFTLPGRHACYPILLHKFLITQGQHVGLMLDALSSADPRGLKFFKPECEQQVVQQIVQQVAPQRIKENREERRKTSTAAKTTPPADLRFQPFLDLTFRAFERKHGQKPTWTGKDFKALTAMLSSNKSLDGLELEKRFCNYLESTEAFIKKQGDSLAYFCTHIDSFLAGPILERNKSNGNHSGKASTVETILDGFQQLQQARTH
jgi:hypothetical protein